MKQPPHPEHDFRIVPAGEFKAKCLQWMDEVSEKKTLTIIITKRGKPVAQMSAPPSGLTISGPTVELLHDTHAGVVSAMDGSASPVSEKHRHKKHKGKKKRK